MQYSLGKESPRDIQSPESRLIVACLTTASGQLPMRSLHLFAFQLVPYTLFNLIVWTFLTMESFAASSSTYPCHLACVSKSVLRDVIPSIGCSTQQPRSAVGVTRVSWGWLLNVPFLRSSYSSGFLRIFFSWQQVWAESACRDAWMYSLQDSSSNAISSPFQYHFHS
jgi:hypothetical protein